MSLLAAAGHSYAQKSLNVSWDANKEANIAGYTVYLGTRSGSYSSNRDTSSTSTVLSDLQPATTYYLAVQAYNTLGVASDLSTEVSFTTQPAPEYFDNWAAGAGLRGNSALPGATPFHDGVSNLLKYAFNMDASVADRHSLASSNGVSGLPEFSLDSSGGAHWFQVEYVRRKNGELQYDPQITSDLVNYQSMTGTTTITRISNDWERVKIRRQVDPATTPRLFGMVGVTQVNTPAGLYDAWAASSGLSGASSATTASPFNDGVTNLSKYAFNLNATGPDMRILASGTGTAGLPRFSFVTLSGNLQFKVEYLRRRNSGLIYTPEYSTDLASFHLMVGTMTVASIDTTWERVTLIMPVDKSTMPRLFGRVRVSIP